MSVRTTPSRLSGGTIDILDDRLLILSEGLRVVRLADEFRNLLHSLAEETHPRDQVQVQFTSVCSSSRIVIHSTRQDVSFGTASPPVPFRPRACFTTVLFYLPTLGSPEPLVMPTETVIDGVQVCSGEFLIPQVDVA